MLPAAVLAAVVVLSGCTPAAHTVTPAPVPSSTPVFASDADALAAATAAYAKYRHVLDAIFKNGGAGTNELDSVAVGAELDAERIAFAKIAESGLRSSGGTTFEVTSLQRYDLNSPSGKGMVNAYVCEDVSAVDVIDKSGKSVVSDSRRDRTLYEVTFDFDFAKHEFLVSNREPWSPPQC